MIILTTTYNCAPYVERSLLSIMSQRFKDFTCYITDDLSTDNTREVIKKTIEGDSRFVLIENHIKLYQPGNYDQVINWRAIPGEEICVEVDGDDWLPDPNVFTRINQVYQDPNVWMTSGSFKYHENGNYWNVAGDLSFMFPMFEMSGEEHYRFLPEINYIYNESNPINDHKVNMGNVVSIVNKIRNKTEYEKL